MSHLKVEEYASLDVEAAEELAIEATKAKEGNPGFLTTVRTPKMLSNSFILVVMLNRGEGTNRREVEEEIAWEEEFINSISRNSVLEMEMPPERKKT